MVLRAAVGPERGGEDNDGLAVESPAPEEQPADAGCEGELPARLTEFVRCQVLGRRVGHIASLLDGGPELGFRSLVWMKGDAGCFSEKVDLGSLDTGHAGQSSLDCACAVGASQPVNL